LRQIVVYTWKIKDEDRKFLFLCVLYDKSKVFNNGCGQGHGHVYDFAISAVTGVAIRIAVVAAWINRNIVQLLNIDSNLNNLN